MSNFNLKEVSKETVSRLIILGIVIVNAILKMAGLMPINIDNSDIYNLITAVSTIAVPLYTAWKNNSITVEAQGADKVMKILKSNVRKNAIEQICTVLNETFEKIGLEDGGDESES